MPILVDRAALPRQGKELRGETASAQDIRTDFGEERQEMSQEDNSVGWFEIPVIDMARARGFYAWVLGEELTEMPMGEDVEMYAFPWRYGAGGASGALIRHPLMRPARIGTLVYFICADVGEAAERAAAAGGVIVQGKTRVGEHGYIALVEDTEGNLIGLHSQR